MCTYSYLLKIDNPCVCPSVLMRNCCTQLYNNNRTMIGLLSKFVTEPQYWSEK